MRKLNLIFCFTTLAHLFLLAKVSEGKSRIEGRITNGNIATANQFPFFVSLLGLTKDNETSLCGGSLISPNWILTAAHCLNGIKSFTVGLNSNSLKSPSFKVETKRFVIYPEFFPFLYMYDIGLIHIELPENFTQTPSTFVQLPKRSISEDKQEYLGKSALIIGHGLTENGTISQDLKFSKMKIVNISDCKGNFNSDVNLNRTLCAKGLAGYKDNACQGDSGGPLVLNTQPWTQIGLLSYAKPGRCQEFGSGYTRVDFYLDWIKNVTGIE